MGPTPGQALLHLKYNSVRVVHILLLLSPSSMIWYWCKNLKGSGSGMYCDLPRNIAVILTMNINISVRNGVLVFVLVRLWGP